MNELLGTASGKYCTNAKKDEVTFASKVLVKILEWYSTSWWNFIGRLMFCDLHTITLTLTHIAQYSQARTSGNGINIYNSLL